MSLPFEVRRADTLFQDSPNAGTPTCVCSRCGELISAEEIPVRVWKHGGFAGEFRFHALCVGLKKTPPYSFDADEEEFEEGLGDA